MQLTPKNADFNSMGRGFKSRILIGMSLSILLLTFAKEEHELGDDGQAQTKAADEGRPPTIQEKMAAAEQNLNKVTEIFSKIRPDQYNKPIARTENKNTQRGTLDPFGRLIPFRNYGPTAYRVDEATDFTINMYNQGLKDLK